jgi:hypothetical protein
VIHRFSSVDIDKSENPGLLLDRDARSIGLAGLLDAKDFDERLTAFAA